MGIIKNLPSGQAREQMVAVLTEQVTRRVPAIANGRMGGRAESRVPGAPAWLRESRPTPTSGSVPRLFQGVVRAATLSGTAPGSFVTLGRGETGDARASSSNSLGHEFLGDYNYVEATRTQAVAVYNDARRGAFCPAVDAFRDSQSTATPLAKPAPANDCPAAFGNTDIYGGIFTP